MRRRLLRYYNSGLPHGMIAVDGDCEFLALVMNNGDGAYSMTEEAAPAKFETAALHKSAGRSCSRTFHPLYRRRKRYLLQGIHFSNLEKYNFAW